MFLYYIYSVSNSRFYTRGCILFHAFSCNLIHILERFYLFFGVRKDVETGYVSAIVTIVEVCIIFFIPIFSLGMKMNEI
jgi:hypothetical protein